MSSSQETLDRLSQSQQEKLFVAAVCKGCGCAAGVIWHGHRIVIDETCNCEGVRRKVRKEISRAEFLKMLDDPDSEINQALRTGKSVQRESINGAESIDAAESKA